MKYLRRLINNSKGTVKEVIKNIRNYFVKNKNNDSDVHDVSTPFSESSEENLESKSSSTCTSNEESLNIKDEYKEEHKEVESPDKKLSENISTISALNFDCEFLISDYATNGEIILHISSGKLIKDTIIDNINFSKRAYNALYRSYSSFTFQNHKSPMVSDILNLTQEQLRNIKNIGTLTADEIINKIRSYLKDENNIIDEESSAEKSAETTYKKHGEYSIKDYIANKGTIIYVPDNVLIKNATIFSLDLSIRAHNSLYEYFKKSFNNSGQIPMISDIMYLKRQQLEQIQNIETSTANEIINKVRLYLLDEDNIIDNGSEIIYKERDKYSINDEYLIDDYATNGEIILHVSSGKLIKDTTIDNLGLSVRAFNALYWNSKNSFNQFGKMPMVSDLLNLTTLQLTEIKGIGTLTADEIIYKMNLYLHNIKNIINSNNEIDNIVLQENELHNNTIKYNVLSKTKILSCFKQDIYGEKSFDEILEMLSEADESEVNGMLQNLVDEKKIVFNDNKYSIYYPSFYEYIYSIESEPHLKKNYIRILQQRFNGLTLEEIAKQEGITKERVRQIVAKALRHITKNETKTFAEDKYKYIYTTYLLDKEFYNEYINEKDKMWIYLNNRYEKGNRDPIEALCDNNIPMNLRHIINKYIHRGYIEIDGEYILIERQSVEDYVVEKYCKDEVTYDEFYYLYNKFLEDNDIMNNNLVFDETLKASRANRLAESKKVLWKQNKRLRYYNIEGTDFTEFFETLNLGQYRNTELSTRKFLLDYPELMKEYDLRDEYEIHNLLKKINSEKENSSITFARMPTIRFGTFDRDEAVKEILFTNAPISQDNLVQILSQKFGGNPTTIAGGWLNSINNYYHEGIYSTDYKKMSEQQMTKLKENLTDDFYFIPELKKIYSDLFIDDDFTMFNTYNLKKIGFIIGGTYVFRNFSSAEAYFNNLLCSEEILDLKPTNKRFNSLSTYQSILRKVRENLEIIEFEEYKYINISKLENAGYNKERLKKFGDRVWNFINENDYFTIRSIKNEGFEDELFLLGFEDLFYSSILKQDNRFCWQNIGKTVVFSTRRRQFTACDFLTDIIKKEKSIDSDTFMNYLNSCFGISYDRGTVVEKIKGSSVYYDSIMEKFYDNYLTYFKEI